jgi:hypothetical protein
MNNALVIATQELSARRFVLITAAVLALIPFAVLLLPGVAAHGAPTVIATTGGFVALAYILGLSLVLGATFVARDLTDKRLSFYFSKPVGAAALWLGKLAGTLATIALSAAIIIIPSTIAAGDEVSFWKGGGVFFIAGAAAIFLAGHAVSTMLRSRSALIIADVVAAAVAAAILYVYLRALQFDVNEAVVWPLAGGLLAIFMGAGAWQLSRGRIDVRASHRELSRFLWSATALLLLIAGGVIAWVVSVTPGDLTSDIMTIHASPEWILKAGEAKNRGGYQAAFFVNVENGAWTRVERGMQWRSAFSARGRRVAGIAEQPGDTGTALELLRFGKRDVESVPTGIYVPAGSGAVFSDDATRVAVLGNDMVTVASVPDGRMLAAARLDAKERTRGFFVTPGLFRVYAQTGGRVDILELDVRTRKLVRTGGFAVTPQSSFNANEDGSRVLVREQRDEVNRMVVADGRTGASLGEVPLDAHRQFGGIMRDGRVMIVGIGHGTRTLFIYTPELVLQRQVALREPVSDFVERSDGKLLFTGQRAPYHHERNGSGWSLQVVDPGNGSVGIARNVQPIQRDFFCYFTKDPRQEVVAAQTPFLVLDTAGKLKRVSL